MTARSRRPSHRGACAATITLLLMLVSLAAPLEVSQPLHLHAAGTAGLYNEEHVLGSLDSVVGDLPLPDARFAVFIALVADARLSAGGARLSTPVLDLTDSRAPPLA
ncbi:MAG TPA: hypothetical protein VID28_18410 [Methylomirabilota bacterium]